MKIRLFQVDAFTDQLFKGNPAAVCPLENWLPDETMQQIALENNLSETAFIVPKGEGFEIRWFTPQVEVDLCGHATLASAHVYFAELAYPETQIVFHSKSGPLTIMRYELGYAMDFPTDTITAIEPTKEIIDLLEISPKALYKGSSDYMVILEEEANVQAYDPDFQKLAKLPTRGIIVTAKGETVDFVSRFFAPQVGINEDPVTGSAHTTLTPYWAQQLNKQTLTARQISEREGNMTCVHKGNRVELIGRAITYLKGEIEVLHPQIRSV